MRCLRACVGLGIAGVLLFVAAEYPYSWQGMFQAVAAFGFVISLGLGLFIDLASMGFSVTSISSAINVKHWDLVRLSLLSRESIITSKHLIASIRTWRMMSFVWILRCLVTICSALSLFIPYSASSAPPIVSMLELLFRYPLELIFITFIVIIFFSTYILEPIWRMYAQTAAGLAISARVHNPLFGSLTALAYIFILWIVQAMIIGIYGWITVISVSGIRNAVIGIFFVFIASGITALTIRGFYKMVQRWALNYANHHAFKDD